MLFILEPCKAVSRSGYWNSPKKKNKKVNNGYLNMYLHLFRTHHQKDFLYALTHLVCNLDSTTEWRARRAVCFRTNRFSHLYFLASYL